MDFSEEIEQLKGFKKDLQSRDWRVRNEEGAHVQSDEILLKVLAEVGKSNSQVEEIISLYSDMCGGFYYQ